MTALDNDATVKAPGLVAVWPDGRLEADAVASRLFGLETTTPPNATSPAEAPTDARLSELLSETLAGLGSSAFPRTVQVTSAAGRPLRLSVAPRPLGDMTILLVSPVTDGTSGDGDSSFEEGTLSMALSPLHRQSAHELRGPLNSMSLHLTLLGRVARGELTSLDNIQQKQQSWVEALVDAADSLSKGIDRWAALTTTEAASSQFLDLRETLIDLDLTVTPLANKLGHGLEIGLPDGAMRLDTARASLFRHLAALTCASVESLQKDGRLRLTTAQGEGQMHLEASMECATDQEPQGATGDDPTPPSTQVARLIPVVSKALLPSGGRLRAVGALGWRITWPLPDAAADRSVDPKEKSDV